MTLTVDISPILDPLPSQVVSSSPLDGVSTAELAECTCPEFCERDHANE